MRLRKLTAASVAALLIGGAAHAATLSVSGERNDLQLTPDNDFIVGSGTNFLADLDFIVNASVTLSAATTLRFTAWGAESGFDNCLEVGAIEHCESDAPYANDDFNGVDDGTRQSFVVDYAAGSISDWLFSGTPSDTSGNELGEFDFGIFFQGSDNGADETAASGLTHFFIAFDDRAGTGAGLDDNHDDYVWKVEVVPLPAAGWMLLAGLGGLAAMRRKKS